MKNNMSSKQRKFSIISKFYTFFNQTSNDICLIAHVSNLNVIESNKIQIYCNKNNIQTEYIKINLLKKLTKNPLFLNLLSGPTKLFFFKDIDSFLNFSRMVPLTKKIHSLAVFFDNQFYSYPFFFTSLTEIKLSNDLKNLLLLNQQQMVVKISKPIANFVQNLNNPL